MLAGFLNRAAVPAVSREPTPVAGPSRAKPDAGYEAIPRLRRLAVELLAVAGRRRSQWKEPPVFFLDRGRQAELEAARAGTPPTEPFPELNTLIAAELPALFASADVRRVARAVPGLQAAARSLAPCCDAAKELAELLAVPDEEVVTVLHPGFGVGFRLLASGTADVGQLHALFLHAADEFLPGLPVPERVLAAARDANPALAGGSSPVIESRFQMHTPAALRPDGSLPAGFDGCGHWLWPEMPFGAIPCRDGERVVLLGPPAFRAAWEVSRRFPALAAEVRLLEVLSPARVAEHLARLAGNPVAVRPQPAGRLAA